MKTRLPERKSYQASNEGLMEAFQKVVDAKKCTSSRYRLLMFEHDPIFFHKDEFFKYLH